MWAREQRREREREQDKANGAGGGRRAGPVMKPSKPVTWAEWEAQGLDDPFAYDAHFLPSIGWDERAKGVAV